MDVLLWQGMSLKDGCTGATQDNQPRLLREVSNEHNYSPHIQLDGAPNSGWSKTASHIQRACFLVKFGETMVGEIYRPQNSCKKLSVKSLKMLISEDHQEISATLSQQILVPSEILSSNRESSKFPSEVNTHGQRVLAHLFQMHVLGLIPGSTS